MNDYFGEADVFKSPDLTFFGDIYATPQQDVEVIFINYDILKRVFFSNKEMNVMLPKMKKRYHEYFYTLAQRYDVEQKLMRIY